MRSKLIEEIGCERTVREIKVGKKIEIRKREREKERERESKRE